MILQPARQTVRARRHFLEIRFPQDRISNGSQDHDSLCSCAEYQPHAESLTISRSSRPPFITCTRSIAKLTTRPRRSLGSRDATGISLISISRARFLASFLAVPVAAGLRSAANGAGNYLQNGATLAVSGSVTYVFSPTLIVDGTFGVTQPHQLLFPTMTRIPRSVLTCWEFPVQT